MKILPDSVKRGLLRPSLRLTPDDCLDAYKHLLDAGFSGEQLIIAGDSAGGNLALVTLLRLREEGLPLPACAIVMSPLTDGTFSGDSVGRNEGHDVMFTHQAFAVLTLHNLPDAKRRVEYMASPLVADLNGLPPPFISWWEALNCCLTIRFVLPANAQVPRWRFGTTCLTLFPPFHSCQRHRKLWKEWCDLSIR